MKKLFLFIATATLALASCTKDVTKEVNLGESINFRTAIGTRGDEFKTGDLESFTVTALAEDNTEEYFTSVEYNRDATVTATYNSDIPYYWPNNDAVLNFYAWANTGSYKPTFDLTNKTQYIVDFIPEAEVADQIDVVVANKSGKKSTGQAGVQLTFKHALSQIAVKVKNSNPNSQYVVKIKAVKIGRVNSKSNLQVTSAETLEPAASSEKTSYTVTLADASVVTLDGGNATAEAQLLMTGAMLIPQQLTAWDRVAETPDMDNAKDGSYISLLVDIDTKTGANVYPEKGYEGGYAWAAIPVGTKWVRNTKYTYTLDFGLGAGYVDPDGEDGTPDTEDEDPDHEPWNPGDLIIDTDGDNIIKFIQVTVDEWTPSDQSVTM